MIVFYQSRKTCSEQVLSVKKMSYGWFDLATILNCSRHLSQHGDRIIERKTVRNTIELIVRENWKENTRNWSLFTNIKCLFTNTWMKFIAYRSFGSIDFFSSTIESFFSLTRHRIFSSTILPSLYLGLLLLNN